jgi:hypothetical protein
MTFIASVIAKKGAAIIADSLVTTTRPLIDLHDFLSYVQNKNKPEEVKESKITKKSDDKISIDFNEVLDLFEHKTSHTKDYEEKLFKYDEYTAITTAGGAVINDKRISEIISNIIDHNHLKAHKKSYSAKTVETKVKDFCLQIESEVKNHLKDKERIGETTFIYTHYNKNQHKTVIYKITSVSL